jgi:glycine cleavage system transcriptional repressor
VQQLILTAIGPDRPGIVGQFTGHLHDADANILDSKMVNLRGQFAIILLIEASPDAITRIRRNLPAEAAKIGLRLDLAEPHAPAQQITGLPFRLKTYSLDQPGIVHRISDVLREHGVNIEDLSARQESAPFAGTPLFLMEMRVTVPPAVSIQKLRADLQSLCDSLNCDIDFEPA